jgi:hypothetical protein
MPLPFWSEASCEQLGRLGRRNNSGSGTRRFVPHFGFPFGFYMGDQGGLLSYLVIVGIYAWYMNRLDWECGGIDGNDP